MKEPIDAKKAVSESEFGYLARRIGDLLIKTVSEVPESAERRAKDPRARALELIAKAAIRAAAVSGTLSLPPGPVGVVTILPDLFAVWRIQAKLVADVAGAYGRRGSLTPQTNMYCLFHHAAWQAVRDIAVRSGQRMLVKKASMEAMQKIAMAVGAKVSQRVLRQAVSRWLPVVGALGVAAYAYYDTGEVGRTAIKFFGSEGRRHGKKKTARKARPRPKRRTEEPREAEPQQQVFKETNGQDL
ncbi:MAG: hypothetical protein ABII00_12215 [Elusimicrobiota bacterium]